MDQPGIGGLMRGGVKAVEKRIDERFYFDQKAISNASAETRDKSD